MKVVIVSQNELNHLFDVYVNKLSSEIFDFLYRDIQNISVAHTDTAKRIIGESLAELKGFLENREV